VSATRPLRFGLWYDFRNPLRWRQEPASLYEGILAQIERAERLGWDDVWLSEHHFVEDGYTPSMLALACAIMHEPGVLFLDEPTSGVDPLVRRSFWTRINAMAAQGVTVMVTTHFMDEAEYCDRIGIIYRGKLIASGSPDELRQQHSSEEIPNPTLEDAFVDLIETYNRDHPL